MTSRLTRIVLLAVVFALATSVVGFAQVPCGVANQITCLPWDGSANLFASQNDTVNGFGNFATVYQQFTLPAHPDLGRRELPLGWRIFQSIRPGPDYGLDP